ncbi:MAG: NupC/NupG family nucleoside CNT transporter [Nannocystaceae bacterium]|nr:NupC/NupG family nucleoside CNT transporter [Nannocystaceae bacterium]
MLAIAYALSRDRKAISKRVVVWGVALQWGIGLLLLRLPQGRQLLAWASSVVQAVLDQSYEGSKFVFGAMGDKAGADSGLGVIFAFQVLPTIIFIASLFSILYYLGIMQLIVRGLAKLMMRTMGTSGAESLAVGASVFMGQTEAPLTIKPFLPDLTESELFVVMVAGMASVSGAILGAYVAIGQVPISHLLTAVAMTAPISIVMAKLMIPETSTPKTSGALDTEVRVDDANVLHAAANGASDGLGLALNVGAMLIAFVALVALVNVILGVIPTGGDPLTLQQIMGALFFPVALLMGVPYEDAWNVGSVLGTRVVLNEIYGFEMIRTMGDQISARSAAIVTVAITGFSSVSSIGILIGGLGGLVPERKKDIARLGVRALIAATLANFTSACVAGALL